MSRTCPTCKGSGSAVTASATGGNYTDTCQTCHGAGTVKATSSQEEDHLERQRLGNLFYGRDPEHDLTTLAQDQRRAREAFNSWGRQAPQAASSAPTSSAPTPRAGAAEPHQSSGASAEITGLGSAKSFASNMAAAYAAAAAGVEQFTASLSGFGVTGEAIAAADQAAEAQQAAASAWAACNAALEKQDVVAEAYHSVPEAGSKEFVTSE